MNNAQSGGISYNQHANHFGDNILGNQIHQHFNHQPLPEIDLNEALALLQALPTELVPDAAPDKIPAWSLFQARPQSHFVGRDSELCELARQLKQRKLSLVTTGIGGVGKSTLASEFVQRYGSYFAGGVFWISFVDPQTAQANLAHCGLLLHLFHEQEGLSQEEQIARVRAEWQKPIPRLLIFDNCDSLSASQCQQFLSEYVPQIGGCRVLITSRNSAWPEGKDLQRLPLGILARSASIALLQSYRPDISDADANTIAEELGDLPLALTLASRFLAKYHSSSFAQPDSYLSQIKSKKLEHRSLQKVDDGERNVFATFELSFQQLNRDDPQDTLALELLARAIYFAPNQAIPSDLLFACLETPADQDPEETEFSRRDALQRLLELGLLEQDDQDNLLIHRLVVQYCDPQLRDPNSQDRVENFLINKTHELANNKISSQLQRLLPHLFNCYQAMEQQNTLHKANLALAIARVEYWQNNYYQAESLYKLGLEIREQILGTEHPVTAQSLSYLAYLYQVQGRHAEAEVLFKRALHITETALSAEHPDTAKSLNNLAMLYNAQGRYGEAEPLSLRALHITETALSSEHPNTPTLFNNLAGVYQAQGRYGEAEPLYLKAVRLHETALGTEHPDTANSLNNLAGLYKVQGRYSEAEPLYLWALRINETALGTEHPTTAISLGNLASVYKAQGRYGEAEPLYLRTLQIHEQTLGTEHPTTATSLRNLASVYKAQGRYGEAEPLYLRALHINEQGLGSEHPDTATSLNNLAGLYESQGRYEEAEPLYLRALYIFEQGLGSEHPDTATLLNNLAGLYESQGRYEEAEPLYLRILRIREQALGIQHPDTATSLNNLATLYVSQGRYGEAELLYQRALSTREQILGSEHPDIAASLNNLASVHCSQKRYTEAEPLYLRALRIFEQVLASEHPTTQIVAQNLLRCQAAMQKSE